MKPANLANACPIALGLSALLAATPAAHAQLTITDVGRYDFTDASVSGARELSGLVLSRASSVYRAIGDKDAQIPTVFIHVDPSAGHITLASINAAPTPLTGATPEDREAIAIQGDHFLMINESGPALESTDFNSPLNDSLITTSTPGFEVFAHARPNRAWESLAVFQANPYTILTANEDALTVDGPAASFSAGAMVRVQAASVDAANSTASAIGQFAYPIDAINGDNPLVSGEQSGLVELLTLPDNTVLAMERAVGLTGYRIRLYEINGENATDVSGFAGLDGLTPGVDYTPLSKTLLWENTFSVLTNSNFEGITLGPILAGGEQSLILVADNASGPDLPFVGQQWTAQDQSLYSLKLGMSGSGVLTGDLNEDGFVGIDDLNIILGQWNQTVFPGTGPDSNVDGFIGIDDLNLILSNWNNGTPPTDLTAIPEPASAALLGLLSFMCVKRTPANRIQ